VSEARTYSADVLRSAAHTDPGRVRTNNEDVPVIDQARGIFGVIDGVGGEAGGEVAAATAHDIILQRLARPLGTPAERVREAIALANNEIFRRAQESTALKGMACVITLAIVADGRLTAGHVGDTRLYKLGADGVRKLTRDHSPVGEREDAGELGEVDAMRHPRRNEVFRDVGSMYRDKDEREFVDIIEEPLERDSAILLCSDGLSDMLTSSTVAHIVRQHAGDPSRVVEALVAAANDAGGKDNVTVVYAEGPLFAASLGPVLANSLTPTEPLSGNSPPRAEDAKAAPGSEPAATGGLLRAVAASRTAWFIAGTLIGVLGALGLMLYVARTQVETAQTLAVAADGSTPYATITAALAVARPGDTIRIEPGDYLEQLVVSTGVDLLARIPGSVTITRPRALDPGVAGVAASGDHAVRISGIRISVPSGAASAGVSVNGTALTLELVDISGPVGSAVTLLPGSSVAMYGSRVAVTGAVASVSDGSQVTFSNNVFQRTASSTQPAIAASPLSRIALSGNVFSGFDPEIVRGVAEARRKELLVGNIIVPPAAAPRAGGRRR
jgi:PPM family protein phosphatase